MTQQVKDAKRKEKRVRESVVLSRCLEFLAMNGFFAWRNNTGAVKIDMSYVRFGHPGSADILGVLPDGRFLGVECKAKGGRVTDEQKIFRKMVDKNKGLYILAQHPTDIEKVFRSEGYLIPGPSVTTVEPHLFGSKSLRNR